MRAGAPEHDLGNQQDRHAAHEDALHFALHFSVDDERHDGDKRNQHRNQIDFPVLSRRETRCGKLAGQGDKGRHQQNVQTHNAKIQLKQARLDNHFAEAAFYHAGFTVEDVVFAVRHHPQG